MRKVTASLDPRQIHMSIEETSAYCNISKQALAQLRYTGKGPKFLKPTARTVLYRKGDVDDWMDANEQISTAHPPVLSPSLRCRCATDSRAIRNHGTRSIRSSTRTSPPTSSRVTAAPREALMVTRCDTPTSHTISAFPKTASAATAVSTASRNAFIPTSTVACRPLPERLPSTTPPSSERTPRQIANTIWNPAAYQPTQSTNSLSCMRSRTSSSGPTPS